MKPPTFAPAYVGLFPILAETAQGCGYALAVHGSVTRDFDLIAVPWTLEAVSADMLVRTLAEKLQYCRESNLSIDQVMELCENKPHGRIAWSIPLYAGSVIDISVTPRIQND